MMWLVTAMIFANAARMLAAYQTGQMYIGWLPPREFRFITKDEDPQLWRNNWIATVLATAAWFVAIGYWISD
jgi:hypothetical protein